MMEKETHTVSYGATPDTMYLQLNGIRATTPDDTASEAARAARRDINLPSAPREMVVRAGAYITPQMILAKERSAESILGRVRRMGIDQFANLGKLDAMEKAAAEGKPFVDHSTPLYTYAESSSYTESTTSTKKRQLAPSENGDNMPPPPIQQPRKRIKLPTTLEGVTAAIAARTKAAAAAALEAHACGNDAKRKAQDDEMQRLQACLRRIGESQRDHSELVDEVVSRDAPLLTEAVLARSVSMPTPTATAIRSPPGSVRSMGMGDYRSAVDAMSEADTRSRSRHYAQRPPVEPMTPHDHREHINKQGSLMPTSRPAHIHHAMSSLGRMLTKQQAALVLARNPCLSWDRRERGLAVPQEGYPHVWGVQFKDFVEMVEQFVHPSMRGRAEECARSAIRTMAHVWSLRREEIENFVYVEAFHKTEYESRKEGDEARIRKVIIIPIDIVLYVFVYMPPLFARVDWLTANVSLLMSINKWRGAAKLRDPFLADVEASIYSMVTSVDSTAHDLRTVSSFALNLIPKLRDLEIKVERLIVDNQELRMAMSVGRMGEANRRTTEPEYEKSEAIPPIDPPNPAASASVADLYRVVMTHLQENDGLAPF